MQKKKRDKKYIEKPTVIPRLFSVATVSQEYPMLALKLHAAVVSLIQRPTVDAGNNLSCQLSYIAGGMSYSLKGASILQRKDASCLAIQSAINAVEAMIDRHEKTGSLFLTED